jgi:class 3 adenylate cyclase
MAEAREPRERPAHSEKPVLVGRGRVLDQCRAWLTESRAGHVRIVLIEGPPGIGKTAVLDHVLRGARDSGAQILAGAGREDVAIPYLPLATAFSSLAGFYGAEVFARSGADHAHDRDTEPSIQTMGASREELALYLAVTEALAAAARRQPVVLALEDLHWADAPTIELLGHVATTASHAGGFEAASLAIVGTMRPAEGSPEVQRGIARLAREPGARRMTLAGLDELATNELLVRLAPRPPSPRLLALVMDLTSGNPLMVRLLLERMIETGDAHVEDGRLTAAPTTELSATPAELDGAVRRVVDAVSPPARDLLIDIALLGDGSSIVEVLAASGSGETEIEPLLDELDRAGILTTDDTSCRFVHPQFRHVATQLPTPRRRQEVHRRIADRLETHFGARAEEHAGTIAAHLERAGPRVDAARLHRWARTAGNQAFLVGAWSEASRHYDTAIEAAAAGEADARLYLLAALGHHHNHDIPACLARLEQATARARATNDLEVWGSAVALALRARAAHTGAAVGTVIDLGPTQEFLDHTVGQVPELRCQLLAQMSEACFAGFDSDRGIPLARQALEVAEELGDDLLMSLATFALGLHHLALLQFPAASQEFGESAARAHAAGDGWYEPSGTVRLALVQWATGDLDRADAGSLAGRDLGRRVADWAEFSLAASIGVGVAVARGQFAEGERQGEQAEQAFFRSSYAFTPPLLYSSLAWARAERGDLSGARAAIAEWERSLVPGFEVFALLCEALVDGQASGLDEYLGLAEQLREAPPSLFTAGYVTALAETSDLTGNAQLAAALLDPLEALASLGLVFCPIGCLFVPRLAAVASLHAGDLGRANRWLDAAERAATVSPVELARSRIVRARVELASDHERDHGARALDTPRRLLLAAASTFDEHGMLPMLERAQALAAPLLAPGTTLPTATRYLLVTDIVGSTALNIGAGDQRWIELLREHNEVSRDQLRNHDGVQFKHTGDGICAWFSNPVSAIECALGTIAELEQRSLLHPEFPIRIRCGVAGGTPLGEGDDLFGISVALASRLCAAAGTSEVLVAEEVARAARGRGLQFGPREALSLKGFPEPIGAQRVAAPSPAAATGSNA